MNATLITLLEYVMVPKAGPSGVIDSTLRLFDALKQRTVVRGPLLSFKIPFPICSQVCECRNFASLYDLVEDSILLVVEDAMPLGGL